jgi:FkbM family methyltransferase
MQPEVKVHVTRNGTQYALFTQREIISDEIRRNQYWNTYNLEIADIVLSENRGNRVIDIGAGLGGFTVPLAIKYMKSHIFEAFEPVPAINQQLNTNALLNRLYNVRCYRFGVADRNEVIDHAIFDLAAVNHGAFSFLIDSYTNRNIPVPNEIDVYELRTLDDFRFGNVALVKITVSGMELEVLKGSGKIIENNQTPPLMIECWNDDWYKERKDAMIELLQQYGYKQVLVRRGFIYAFNDINLSKKVEQRLSEQVPGSKVMFK